MYYVMELLVAFTFPKPPVDNKSRWDDTNNFQLPLNLYQKEKHQNQQYKSQNIFSVMLKMSII